jgi:hypothetical protein
LVEIKGLRVRFLFFCWNTYWGVAQRPEPLKLKHDSPSVQSEFWVQVGPSVFTGPAIKLIYFYEKPSARIISWFTRASLQAAILYFLKEWSFVTAITK